MGDQRRAEGQFGGEMRSAGAGAADRNIIRHNNAVVA